MIAWMLACSGDPPAEPVVAAPPPVEAPAAPPEAPAAVERCSAPEPGCTCPGDGRSPACFPAYDGSIGAIPPEVRADIEGRSWRLGCPVPVDDLALLSVPHWDDDGEIVRGELVVAQSASVDVLAAFGALYDARFPIHQMKRVDAYDADDRASMAADNTSGFNCRPVAGTDRWSEHAYGLAIDINPLQNPYVSGSRVSPPEGAKYADRTVLSPGGIGPDGVVVRAFADIGWRWGGDWAAAKDYQHVSKSGR